MNDWELAHAVIGGAASLIFLFQVFAGAHADADSDVSDGEGDSLVHYLSVRNFVAFFIGYGWVTLAGLISGLPKPMASACGAFSGVVFAAVSIFLIRTFLRFQEDGSIKLDSLIGGHASVYITIGESGSVPGKVMADTQKGRMELPARTHDAETLHPGKMVKIIEVDGGILWVTGDYQ